MAEESLISSLYPPPPPYYKFFTKENLQKFKEFNKDEIKNDDFEFKDDDKELNFLIPPKPPSGETYRSFGNLWNVSIYDKKGQKRKEKNHSILIAKNNSLMIKYQN